MGFHEIAPELKGLDARHRQLGTPMGQVERRCSSGTEVLSPTFFTHARHREHRLESLFRHGGRFVATSAPRQG